MAESISFLRKFIVLESHTKTKNLKGFAKIEIKSGKGKLKINIDGLKNIDKDNLLKGYLISDNDKNLDKVYIGTLNVKDNGKGSLDWEFKSNALGDEKISFDKVDMLLIKSSGHNESISIVGKIKDKALDVANILNKFTDEIIVKKEINKINVNNNKKSVDLMQIDNDLNKPLDEIINEVKAVKVEKNIEENLEAVKVEEISKQIEDVNLETVKIEEIDKEVEDINLDTVEIGDVRVKNNNIKAETEKKEIINENGNDINLETENIEIKDEMIEEVKEERIEEITNDKVEGQNSEYIEEDLEKVIEKDYIKFKSLQSDYMEQMNNYYGNSIKDHNKITDKTLTNSDQLEEYTMNILQYFDQIDVLKRNLPGYEWYKIEVDDNKYREFLPYYHYTINRYYPYPIMYKEMTTQKLIKKYNHYIFGIVREDGKVKHYAYGVPGRYRREEQPYGGKTGFMTWIESKARSRSRYRLGYWILHIDPISGKIVNPLKPTQPR